MIKCPSCGTEIVWSNQEDGTGAKLDVTLTTVWVPSWEGGWDVHSGHKKHECPEGKPVLK